MLNVVQSRARELAARNYWALAPFGLCTPHARQEIAAAARSTSVQPDEVWCASGSGTLARGLALAWPSARRHTVQVGHRLMPAEVGGATIHLSDYLYRVAVPWRDFSSDEHYESKAWRLCCQQRGDGVVVFWNVTTAAPIP